jgi:hypothetical protein
MSTTDAGARPAPGWYPDYDAAPGSERYWNGEEWTDGRREHVVAEVAAPRERRQVPHVPAWVYVGTAALVALAASVLVLGGDDAATSGGRDAAVSRVDDATPPPPASTPGPPPSESEQVVSVKQRQWPVASVADGRTLVLENGAEVRLIGVAGGCAPGVAVAWLESHVDGASVALTRDGADKDAQGHLLRYASLDGADVGLAMLEAGVATAAGGHPRAADYAAASVGCS